MLFNAILTCCKLLHLSVVFITNFYIKLWYVTIRVVSVVRIVPPLAVNLLYICTNVYLCLRIAGCSFTIIKFLGSTPV